MSHLKKQNVKQCVSLLRDYIENTPSNCEKGGAILALNQLQNISAGTGSSNPAFENNTTDEDPNCNGKPRANITLP